MMSITKNPTAASLANQIANRIEKLKKKPLTDSEKSVSQKNLKDLQRIFIVLVKEAYHTFI